MSTALMLSTPSNACLALAEIRGQANAWCRSSQVGQRRRVAGAGTVLMCSESVALTAAELNPLVAVVALMVTPFGVPFLLLARSLRAILRDGRARRHGRIIIASGATISRQIRPHSAGAPSDVPTATLHQNGAKHSQGAEERAKVPFDLVRSGT
jgi:hypothetical protein